MDWKWEVTTQSQLTCSYYIEVSSCRVFPFSDHHEQREVITNDSFIKKTFCWWYLVPLYHPMRQHSLGCFLQCVHSNAIWGDRPSPLERNISIPRTKHDTNFPKKKSPSDFSGVLLASRIKSRIISGFSAREYIRQTTTSALCLSGGSAKWRLLGLSVRPYLGTLEAKCRQIVLIPCAKFHMLCPLWKGHS